MVGGEFHLDDVRAELGSNLRGVTAYIDGSLARCAQAGAPRIGPDDYREAVALRFLCDGADSFIHFEPMCGAGINREPDRRAAEPECILDAAGDGLVGILFVEERIVVAQLEDERDVAGEFPRASFQESQRRGVGVATSLDRQFKMIERIIRGRIRREAPCRAVLKALIDGQDHELSCASEPPVVQYPGEIRQCAGIVAAIPTENFTDAFFHNIMLLVVCCV